MGFSADEFELAFLSDERERRKGVKVFTRCHCRVDDWGIFHFGCHAGLLQTEEGTLDERVGHALPKFVRERCKYWLCCRLSYEDVETELHVVKAFCFLRHMNNACNKCLGSRHPGHGIMP